MPEKNTLHGEKDLNDKDYKLLFEESLQLIKNLSLASSPEQRIKIQKKAFEFLKQYGGY